MTIYRGPGGGGNSTSDSELSALTALTQEAAGYKGEAAASATAAASSASAASTSADSAATSATSASTSAVNAAASETSTSNSASNAASSASAAATSATNAANSATAASTSASNASSSASGASTSASNAAASATNAANSATAASNSASTASTKASEASTSAANAASSATSASTSASTATTKASEASTSASNAATSASNAATSATNAANSATAAANSAASINDANLVHKTGAETIAGVKTFSDNVVVPSINGGQLAGLRNKIINGKMEIAQRGTSFAAATDGTHGVDRWRYEVGGTTGVVTLSQQADVPSGSEFQNSLRVAVTTADSAVAAGDLAFIGQRIEGYNVSDLIGRPLTISFRVRSSKTGVHCVSLRNNGTDRSYVAEYTVNAANTWESKTVTVPAGLITAGAWHWTNGVGLRLAFALISSTTFHTTKDAWQTGNLLATVNQVNCLDTVGNIFAITGVQLEVGSVATPFEHRPYGTEAGLCQRYYKPVKVAVQSSFTVTVQHSPPMRTGPTTTGGGAGFSTGWSTDNSTGVLQTTAAVQDLVFSAEL